MQVKPWVISFRGHYSNRLIRTEVINEIKSYLFANLSNHSEKLHDVSLAVHFRLGDLVELQSKGPISDARVANGLSVALSSRTNISSVSICSDSPELACKKIGVHFSNINFLSEDLDALDTLRYLSRIQSFVGTPSKISEWVALLRTTSGLTQSTYLPIEMMTQLQKISEESQTITYY